MKKNICLLLVLTLLFAVTACAKKEESSIPEIGSGEPVEKPKELNTPITKTDLPADPPAEVQDLTIVMPDGSEQVLTRDEAIENIPLFKQSQIIINKEGLEIKGEFMGIKVKDALAYKGYSGGATSFFLSTAKEQTRDLHHLMIDTDEAFFSFIRDGKWNMTGDNGTFQFVYNEESPKDVWATQVIKVELNK